MHLEIIWGKCVSSMKKVFSFHWISVFVQIFCEFVEVILNAHARKWFSKPTTDPATRVRYPAGITFLFFLSCVIYNGLFIALGLHRNSINDMNITYYFLLHLLVQLG
jgi:hypothetical protein